ncbi:hypothetical protein H0H81_003489 [Sphagnurus paluster]|uniref:Uncharacterized protein n=1 Tax=Sphagnurus paluster TaxID=117069 RepID=A0A9P7K2C4_9AGAR|nr:hypothetical protein H0H81_003489 [Sphagnurus paluster]
MVVPMRPSVSGRLALCTPSSSGLDALGRIRFYQWQRTVWAARRVELDTRLDYLDNHFGTGMAESDEGSDSDETEDEA